MPSFMQIAPLNKEYRVAQNRC